MEPAEPSRVAPDPSPRPRAAEAPTVLVTGTSSGIGRATALALDRRGFRVFAGVRRERDASRLSAGASRNLAPLLLDVADTASVNGAARRIEHETRRAGLFGLVHNAGIVVPGALEHLEIEDLRGQFEVAVFGAHRVTRALLPQLRRSRGRIVHVGSMSGYLATPFLGPYAAAKFALRGLNDTLRRELRPWGIHVTLVVPGNIATPLWDKGMRSAAALEQALPPSARTLYGPHIRAARSSLERAARWARPPERVAEVVAQALTTSRPRTRYHVGVDAQVARAIAALLPERIVDALMARLGRAPDRARD